MEDLKDSDLIDGLEALRALADGKDVQVLFKENIGAGWYSSETLKRMTIEKIISGNIELRIKPQTIKLELEIPAPFQPKEGEECCYITDESIDGYHTIDYSSDRYSGMHFGLYRPSDIKKVVALFRSALGG